MPFVGTGDEEILRCPKCSASLHKVLETRHTTSESVSRRRKCSACGHVWGTVEVSLDASAFCYRDRGGKRTDGRRRADFGVKLEAVDMITGAIKSER